MEFPSVDSFTMSYMTTALWASTLDDGTPMDKDYDVTSLAPETIGRMIQDCYKFQKENESLLSQLDTWDDIRHGFNFWLTRNRHGAGFWDGDYPEDIGKKLTDSAHGYGEVDLYIGDDGLIYQG